MADVRRCLGMLLLALLFVPSPATAHSTDVLTNPEDGARLASLPAEATMAFSEAPTTAAVVLRSPDGRVHQLASQIDDTVVLVRLPPNGPRGEYTLSYRVVSADGHPVSGAITFTVAAGPTPSASAAETEPRPAAEEPTRGPLAAIVVGVALVGVAATVFAARSIRR